MKRRMLFGWLVWLVAMLVAAPACALGGGHWTSWARRSWLVRDIPNAVLWLRADTGVTSSSNNVSAWTDQTTAGNSASQATGSAQPLFEAAGFNGKASIKFNGTSQFVSANGVAASLSGSSAPYFLGVAGQYVTVTASDAISATSSSTDSPFTAFGSDGTSYRTRRRDDSVTAVVISATTANTSAHVFSNLFSGTTNSLWVDNTARAGDPTAMSLGTMTVNRFSIGCLNLSSGAAAFANFRFAEVVVVARSISTTERTLLQTYLGQKFSITLN